MRSLLIFLNVVLLIGLVGTLAWAATPWTDAQSKPAAMIDLTMTTGPPAAAFQPLLRSSNDDQDQFLGTSEVNWGDGELTFGSGTDPTPTRSNLIRTNSNDDGFGVSANGAGLYLGVYLYATNNQVRTENATTAIVTGNPSADRQWAAPVLAAGSDGVRGQLLTEGMVSRPSLITDDQRSVSRFANQL